MKPNQQSFFQFVRSRPVTDTVTLANGHPMAGAEPFPTTDQTEILGLLLKTHSDLDGMEMRLLKTMLACGAFGAIRRIFQAGEAVGAHVVGYNREPVEPPQYEAYFAQSLDSHHGAADTKGLALIIRAPSGKMKAILGGEHYFVETVAQDLVKVGGYYEAYLKVATIRRRSPSTGEFEAWEERFLVPLPHREVCYSVDEAREGFGGTLSPSYRRQAATHAALRDQGVVVGQARPAPRKKAAKEDPRLAQLKAGGSVVLGSV